MGSSLWTQWIQLLSQGHPRTIGPAMPASGTDAQSAISLLREQCARLFAVLGLGVRRELSDEDIASRPHSALPIAQLLGSGGQVQVEAGEKFCWAHRLVECLFVLGQCRIRPSSVLVKPADV